MVLRFIDSPLSRGRTFRFKTLKGARAKAHRLVTATPKRDHDGYAVHPKTGDCLFFVEGCTFELLFPQADPQVEVLQQGEP